MPYIEASKRDLGQDICIAELQDWIDADGAKLNYVLSRLAGAFVFRLVSGGTPGYTARATALGHVRAFASEFHRRILPEYEERKRLVNGDLPEYGRLAP